MQKLMRLIVIMLCIISGFKTTACQASIQCRTLNMDTVTMTNEGFLKAEQGWFPRLERLENSGSIFIDRVWMNHGAVISFANTTQLTVESRAVKVFVEPTSANCEVTFLGANGVNMDSIKIAADAQTKTAKLCLDADAGEVKIAVPQTCMVIVNSPAEYYVITQGYTGKNIAHVDKAELRTHVEANGPRVERKPTFFEAPTFPTFSEPSVSPWARSKTWGATVAQSQEPQAGSSDGDAWRAERAARLVAEQKAEAERKLREKKAEQKDLKIFLAIAIPTVVLMSAVWAYDAWKKKHPSK